MVQNVDERLRERRHRRKRLLPQPICMRPFRAARPVNERKRDPRSSSAHSARVRTYPAALSRRPASPRARAPRVRASFQEYRVQQQGAGREQERILRRSRSTGDWRFELNRRIQGAKDTILHSADWRAVSSERTGERASAQRRSSAQMRSERTSVLLNVHASALLQPRPLQPRPLQRSPSSALSLFSLSLFNALPLQSPPRSLSGCPAREGDDTMAIGTMARRGVVVLRYVDPRWTRELKGRRC